MVTFNLAPKYHTFTVFCIEVDIECDTEQNNPLLAVSGNIVSDNEEEDHTKQIEGGGNLYYKPMGTLFDKHRFQTKDGTVPLAIIEEK